MPIDIWAIEIKRGLTTRPGKGFHNAREDLKPKQSFVVYPGEGSHPITKDVEAIGLVKFDFLSLNTLDVIQDTLNLVNITLDDIPKDDEATFKTISTTSNVGIFQLSSDGISRIANNVVV